MSENREIYFVLFFVGIFVLSFFVTRLVRRLAVHLGIQDTPDLPRKIHPTPKPKLGGVGIFLSFLIGITILAILGGTDEISSLRIAGLILGGAILIIGGILDDKYDLSARYQICFPVTAAALVVLTGTHISYITNPLGGPVILDQYKIANFPVLGSLLVFGWILLLTYTTKFLDGMDGLVSGISGIAALVIFGNRASNDFDQFPGRQNSLLPPPLDYFFGDLPRESLFAVFIDDASQFFFAFAVYNVRRRGSLIVSRVVTHIERLSSAS